MEEQIAEQKEEFSNDLVRFSANRKADCIIEFDVHASTSLIEKEHKQAVKAVAKQVSLPGFRKGRAPEELIVKKFPKDVDQKWQQLIADAAFKECIKISKHPILQGSNKVSFTMKQHDLKKGAHLTLQFETEPVIPSVDPKLIEIKEITRPEVNKEKVDETIRQVQLFFAEWAPVEGRPVKEGDFVLLDVEVVETSTPEKVFENTRFEVSDKYMAKWMQDLVLGQKQGSSLEGISKPDDTLSEKEKEEFAHKKTRVTIKKIETATVPDLNEDFAKKLGVASVEDLFTNIEKMLHKQADAHVTEKLRDQVSDELLKKFHFDLPKTLVQKETEFRLKQLYQDPDFEDHWKRIPNTERRNMVESIYLHAEKAVRMFYLCRKIISEAKISVSPKDLPKRPTTPLEALLQPQSFLQPQPENEPHQAEAFSKLILEKAQDYIISKASSPSETTVA